MPRYVITIDPKYLRIVIPDFDVLQPSILDDKIKYEVKRIADNLNDKEITRTFFFNEFIKVHPISESDEFIIGHYKNMLFKSIETEISNRGIYFKNITKKLLKNYGHVIPLFEVLEILNKFSNTIILDEMNSIKFDTQLFKKDLITKRCIDNDLTMEVAAKEIGISKATLSRLEKAKYPDVGTFFKVCVWLNKSPNIYLIKD